MNDMKEKTGIWKNWMSIVIILVMVIMVLWFNSQSPSSNPVSDKNISIENGTNVSIENGTNVSIENGTNVSTGNNTNIADNDTLFKNWVAINTRTVTEDLNCISEAGKSRNFTNVERCGRFLGQNSNISLTHIDRYNVSSSMMIALDEYKKALEEYYIGGINLEIGARNENASQMNDAVGHIQNGTTRVERVLGILYGNDTLNTKYVYSNEVNASNVSK